LRAQVGACWNAGGKGGSSWSERGSKGVGRKYTENGRVRRPCDGVLADVTQKNTKRSEGEKKRRRVPQMARLGSKASGALRKERSEIKMVRGGGGGGGGGRGGRGVAQGGGGGVKKALRNILERGREILGVLEKRRATGGPCPTTTQLLRSRTNSWTNTRISAHKNMVLQEAVGEGWFKKTPESPV